MLKILQSMSEFGGLCVGEQGGEWGKQVGSTNEESQVSVTFIYTNQETV